MSNSGIATRHRQWFSTRTWMGFVMWWRRTFTTTIRSLWKGLNENVRSMVDYGFWARHLISCSTRHVNFTLTRCDFITIWGQCYVASTGMKMAFFRGNTFFLCPVDLNKWPNNNIMMIILSLHIHIIQLLSHTVNYRDGRFPSCHRIRSNSMRDHKWFHWTCDWNTSWWWAIAHKMWYFTVNFLYAHKHLSIIFHLIEQSSLFLTFFTSLTFLLLLPFDTSWILRTRVDKRWGCL